MQSVTIVRYAQNTYVMLSARFNAFLAYLKRFKMETDFFIDQFLLCSQIEELIFFLSHDIFLI